MFINWTMFQTCYLINHIYFKKYAHFAGNSETGAWK